MASSLLVKLPVRYLLVHHLRLITSTKSRPVSMLHLIMRLITEHQEQASINAPPHNEAYHGAPRAGQYQCFTS